MKPEKIEKKAYTTPKLAVHGSVEKITQLKPVGFGDKQGETGRP